jgi:hypothetical protein
MQGETRERTWQHGAQVLRQVVLPAVEQILQVQSGLGFPFDGETTLEEERVGIFPAACEIDEVLQRPANRHVRRSARGPQSATRDLEAQRERNVLDAQAEALAREFVEPARERLAAQQLVDRERKQPRLQRRRRAAQDLVGNGNRVGRHDGLARKRTRHSCHGRAHHGLIPVNTRNSPEALRRIHRQALR